MPNLFLSLELRADWASNRGNNEGGNSNMGNSISSLGSSDSWSKYSRAAAA